MIKKSRKSILAIGSHPDDIEYGCGGTLLKAVQAGWEIFLLVMTDGRMGGDPEARKKEQLEAAEFIGTKDVFFGNIPDTQLMVDHRTIDMVSEKIELTKPAIVLVNYYNDSHQDHRACAGIVAAACRQRDSVLYYEDYTSINFNPNVFVDITDVIEKKEDLISLHKTQVDENFYPTIYDLRESVRAIGIFRGFQARKKFAEGFLPLRYHIDLSF